MYTIIIIHYTIFLLHFFKWIDGAYLNSSQNKYIMFQITRFCQDQYVTTSLEFVEISNILSNIFDGLSKQLPSFRHLMFRILNHISLKISNRLSALFYKIYLRI